MKSITINGSKRESVGKESYQSVTQCWQMVPCVLYGGGEPLHFSAAKELDFSKLVYTPNAHTVVINLEGRKYCCYFAGHSIPPINRQNSFTLTFYQSF
jgi:large subunit ribosomal protein L25